MRERAVGGASYPRVLCVEEAASDRELRPVRNRAGLDRCTPREPLEALGRTRPDVVLAPADGPDTERIAAAARAVRPGAERWLYAVGRGDGTRALELVTGPRPPAAVLVAGCRDAPERLEVLRAARCGRRWLPAALVVSDDRGPAGLEPPRNVPTTAAEPIALRALVDRALRMWAPPAEHAADATAALHRAYERTVAKQLSALPAVPRINPRAGELVLWRVATGGTHAQCLDAMHVSAARHEELVRPLRAHRRARPERADRPDPGRHARPLRGALRRGATARAKPPDRPARRRAP